MEHEMVGSSGCFAVLLFILIWNFIIPFVFGWLQIGWVLRSIYSGRSSSSKGDSKGDDGITWGSSFQNQ